MSLHQNRTYLLKSACVDFKPLTSRFVLRATTNIFFYIVEKHGGVLKELGVGLPDLANKRTGHPTAIDSHINIEYIFSITIFHVRFKFQIHK